MVCDEMSAEAPPITFDSELKIRKSVPSCSSSRAANDRDGPATPSALTQTEDTGIGASFSKIALAEVVHVKGRQSLLWALM
jgi:hypothetical protein